ncbi:hypothetical protein ACFONN_14205 [Dyella humi]|uniref:Uncharacterized protein n=1 Tax=Dyella humi TaxID=1770547 RepID=A0ABW8ILQ5_9GAMM
MANPIENTEDVIDSRDVIERIEELEADLRDRHEVGGFMSDFDDWIADSRDDSGPVHAAFPDDGGNVVDLIQELYDLRKLAEEAEHSADWPYGETLIRESYFTDYIE